MPSPLTIRRSTSGLAFKPANYGGGTLRGWFKADSLSLADGASVTTWADSSGNGNDATAGTAPVYKVGVQNGKPGVLFTRSSSQYLIANGLASVQSGTDLPYTVILAVKQATLASTETFCAWGPSVGSSFSTCDANATTMQMQRRDDASAAKTPASTGVDTNANVLTYTFTGTTGAIFRNGTAGTMSVSDGDIGLMTNNQFAIGALYRTTPASFLDGHIFELLVYASALSASDRTAIERALGAKWGITVA